MANLKSNEYFMEQAIRVAKETQKAGGFSIGAVLINTKTGKTLSLGGSTVGLTKDPTSHAEINCIRQASAKIDSDNLSGYTLYSTLEPCQMCLSAAAWARISNVYFGAYRKDVDKNLFDTENINDEEQAKYMHIFGDTKMHVQGGILEKECANLLT